jgi:hypothetical protein
MLEFLKLLSRVGTMAAGLVLLPGFVQAAPAERVFVTEFMAANTRTLMDRDRQCSDWIEVYNAGASNVNLAGWCLTDDREDLTKWRFPAVNLPPAEFLLVFASGKDRRMSGGELHTNFKLDAGGEYLALVRPDGATIASEFAPTYPPQMADVSYGLSMGARSTPLVPTNAPKRVFVPTNDIGMSWATPEFDDRHWLLATNGAGFDASGNYAGFIGADLGGVMRGRASSAYMRLPFVLSESGFDRLRLRLRYDDGFAAYLNGWDVARRNAPQRARWNSTATNAHGVSIPLVWEVNFESLVGPYTLLQMDPRARPRVSWPNTGSSGRFLRLVNGRLADQVNGIAFPQMAPGVFESVQADFDYRIRGSGPGGFRLAFMLVPVTQFGTNGPGLDGPALARHLREIEMPGILAVVLQQDPGAATPSLSVQWNRTRYRSVSIAQATLDPREFHRVGLTLEHAGEGAFVTVALSPKVNAGTGARYTPIDRLFIRGLNPYAHRIQIAGWISDWDRIVDLDNIRAQLLPKSGTAVEEFDLAGHLDALRPGTNLLALHGLNVTAEDPTFLLQPEIIVAQGSLQPNDRRYFAQPTPRTLNGEGFATAAPPPVVSVKGGVFKDHVTVELRTSATNGTVRYTLNGTEPAAVSDAATGPITINACVQLKAKTFVPGQLPSPTVTETYSVLDPSLRDFNSNLPLVILNSFGKYISQNAKTPVAVRFIDGGKGRAAITGPADFDGRGTLNVRGFSTVRQPKNSYTLNFRDDNGDKLRASVLGLPKDADWVLYAPYVDKTLIRDALAYELSNQMGRYAPRTRFVEVFLHRYGARLSYSDYLGVYVFEEKITRGKNRVNVQEMSASDNTEPAVTGGYIIKRDHSRRREPNFDAGRTTDFFFVYPEPEDISPAQRNYIVRYMTEFDRALYGPRFLDPKQGYAAYLDADSFIDHHWLVEMSKNVDGLRYSAFLHKDRGGKLVVGPVWDWNLSWGNANYQDGWRTEGWYTDLLRDTELCWYRRLSQDPDFTQRTIDRWWELRRDVFHPAKIHARIDEWAALLNEAQQRNFGRWPILGRTVHPNYYVGRTYADEIAWLKRWIRNRIAWIDEQSLAPPALTPGAPLTLRAPVGRILYTLDGTDPRQPGGTMHPKAQVYKEPVPVSGSAKVFARVLHGTAWSGPTVAEFKP